MTQLLLEQALQVYTQHESLAERDDQSWSLKLEFGWVVDAKPARSVASHSTSADTGSATTNLVFESSLATWA